MSGPIDVFIVAGQSNAEGKGSSASSPVVPAGVAYEYTDAGTLVALADPVGGAVTGSAWPAFAIALHNLTDRPLCIVETALSGSPLIAANDGFGAGNNWSPTGTLRSAAVTKADAALTHLSGAGWTPTLQGVLWHQGESDAQFGNGSPTLAADYAAALSALGTYFGTGLSLPDLPMFVHRIGENTAGSYPGYAVVRGAQDSVCASDARLHMVYTECVNFPGLGYMKGDGLHYNQSGLNAMGTGSAPNVYALLPTDPPPVSTARNSILARRLLGL